MHFRLFNIEYFKTLSKISLDFFFETLFQTRKYLENVIKLYEKILSEDRSELYIFLNTLLFNG